MQGRHGVIGVIALRWWSLNFRRRGLRGRLLLVCHPVGAGGRSVRLVQAQSHDVDQPRDALRRRLAERLQQSLFARVYFFLFLFLLVRLRTVVRLIFRHIDHSEKHETPIVVKWEDEDNAFTSAVGLVNRFESKTEYKRIKIFIRFGNETGRCVLQMSNYRINSTNRVDQYNSVQSHTHKEIN